MSGDLLDRVGREVRWQLGPAERHQHPVEKRGQCLVVELGLGDAGHLDEEGAPLGQVDEAPYASHQIRHLAGGTGAVGQVATLAVEDPVDPRRSRRRSREGDNECEQRNPHSGRLGQRAQLFSFSTATPSTIAVEQLYTWVALPMHQLMSLLRNGM